VTINGRGEMLAVTSQAAAAIDDILAARELPQDAGLRITAEIDVSGDDGPAPAVQLELVEAPESGDPGADGTLGP
jgi:hypothetical protein